MRVCGIEDAIRHHLGSIFQKDLQVMKKDALNRTKPQWHSRLSGSMQQFYMIVNIQDVNLNGKLGCSE